MAKFLLIKIVKNLEDGSETRRVVEEGTFKAFTWLAYRKWQQDKVVEIIESEMYQGMLVSESNSIAYFELHSRHFGAWGINDCGAGRINRLIK